MWVRLVVMRNGRPAGQESALISQWVETIDIRVSDESSTLASADDLDPLDGPSGEVRGTVRAADGTAVAGARLVIGDTTVATRTDAAGAIRVRAAAVGALHRGDGVS